MKNSIPLNSNEPSGVVFAHMCVLCNTFPGHDGKSYWQPSGWICSSCFAALQGGGDGRSVSKGQRTAVCQGRSHIYWPHNCLRVLAHAGVIEKDRTSAASVGSAPGVTSTWWYCWIEASDAIFDQNKRIKMDWSKVHEASTWKRLPSNSAFSHAAQTWADCAKSLGSSSIPIKSQVGLQRASLSAGAASLCLPVD